MNFVVYHFDRFQNCAIKGVYTTFQEIEIANRKYGDVAVINVGSQIVLQFICVCRWPYIYVSSLVFIVRIST